MLRFHDRKDAGQQLAAQLLGYTAQHPIILALPRGGVPVGYEVAKALRAPLDVWVVRKLGLPWQPEVGFGAVAEGGLVHLNRDILENVKLSEDEVEAAIEEQRREVEGRVRRFRRGLPPPQLAGRTVIVVDDGIATGGTVRVALRAIGDQQPKQTILAIPVAPAATVRALEPEVARVVCIRAPHDLHAIGQWYDDFSQVPDDEVIRLLDRARREPIVDERANG